MQQFIKDILFPVFCFGCKKEGVLLCEPCKKEIVCSGICACPMCHEPQAFGTCCDECAPHSSLDAHIAGVPYAHETTVARLVEALKYQFVTDVAPLLAGLLFPVFDRERSFISQVDMIIPVPLHPRRYAERGFNQAELIATVIGQECSISVIPALRRVRYTKQQARLQQDARAANVQDVFAVSDDDTMSVEGMTVMLVDDVFTTGSTMQSAAHVLKQSGAASVVGVSVARG